MATILLVFAFGMSVVINFGRRMIDGKDPGHGDNEGMRTVE